MIKLFLGNRSGVLLVLPFLIAIYVLSNIFFGHHPPLAEGLFGFWGKWSNEGTVFSQIMGPLTVLIGAILINQLYNRNGFREKNIYIPALIYVVFQSFFHGFYYLNGFSVAQLFLVLMVTQLFKLDQNVDGRKTVFNAAFLLGIATTFYPFLLVFVPFLFAMIWVFRPFIFRESALIVVGFMVPLVYAGVYQWFLGIRLENNEFSPASPEWILPDLYVIGGAALIMAAAGIGPLLQKAQQSSIRLKKLFRILWFFLMASATLSTLELLAFQKLEPAILMSLAFALFITYGFGDKKPRPLISGIFYVVFLFSVCKFFIPFDF